VKSEVIAVGDSVMGRKGGEVGSAVSDRGEGGKEKPGSVPLRSRGGRSSRSSSAGASRGEKEGVKERLSKGSLRMRPSIIESPPPVTSRFSPSSSLSVHRFE
jgi:hypothetical protein